MHKRHTRLSLNGNQSNHPHRSIYTNTRADSLVGDGLSGISIDSGIHAVNARLQLLLFLKGWIQSSLIDDQKDSLLHLT